MISFFSFETQIMSSSSRFIDDECGVASQETMSSLEMDDMEEVEEPTFVTDRSLEGLTGEDLRVATLKLIYQEMGCIMPPACFGSKLYIMHLACLYISVTELDSWELALEKFIEDFEVSIKIFFTDLPRELVEKLVVEAFEKRNEEKISDKRWGDSWFMGLKRLEHQ